MNRSFAVAVLAAVIGVAATAIYFTMFAPAPKTGGCGNSPHCRDVVVGTVMGGPMHILPIADDTFTAPGVMKWELNTSGAGTGYYFPADGINFYPTPPKPDPHQARPGEFFNCTSMQPSDPKPTSYQCNVLHGRNGEWAYLVTLKKTGSPDLTLDPYILNN